MAQETQVSLGSMLISYIVLQTYVVTVMKIGGGW